MKIKLSEEKIRQKYLEDRYIAICEMILHAELGIRFLRTKEGTELNGAVIANEEIKKYEELLRIKKAEKNFIESIMQNG